MFRVRIAALGLVALVIPAGCSDGDLPTQADRSAEPLAIVSRGASFLTEPREICGQTVYPRPAALPSTVGQVVGDHFTLTDLFVDPLVISPGGDVVDDEARFSVRAVVPRPADADQHDYYLYTGVAIYSVETCFEVRDLTQGPLPVNFPSIGGPTRTVVNHSHDFDDLSTGTLVSALPGVSVACSGPAAASDSCVVLNSAAPGTPATIRTTDEGNILVIGRKTMKDADGDGLIDRPQVAPIGGLVELTFDQPTEVHRLRLTHPRGRGAPRSAVTVHLADGGSRQIELDDNIARVETRDVVKLEVQLRGQVGIAQLDYSVESVAEAPSGVAEVLVEDDWDARNSGGGALSNGEYFFFYAAAVVRDDSLVVEILYSGAIGFTIDETVRPDSEG